MQMSIQFDGHNYKTRRAEAVVRGIGFGCPHTFGHDAVKKKVYDVKG